MPFFNDPQSPLGQPFPKTLAGWGPIPMNFGNAVPAAPGAGLPPGAGAPMANLLHPGQATYQGYDAAGGMVPGGGSLPGSYDPAYGGIPKVPTSGESLQHLLDAIGQNLGNLGPIISSITGAQNKALRDEYPTSYFDTLKTLMDTNAERAKGNILDLIPGLGQYAGEWGIGRGVSGGPAANTNLLASLALTKKGVEDEALKGLGAIQNLIPKVNPYDPARLLPGYPDTSSEDLLRNYLGSAGIPKDVTNRIRDEALAGLARGFNAGGGGYGGGYGRGFGAFTPPTPTRPLGPGFRGGVPNPTLPGWGVASNDEGGFASAGNVPAWALPPGVAGLPEGGLPPLGPVQDNTPFFNRNLWDNPLDMPQDLGAGFDENGFMV